jgi:hypothetical protein
MSSKISNQQPTTNNQQTETQTHRPEHTGKRKIIANGHLSAVFACVGFVFRDAQQTNTGFEGKVNQPDRAFTCPMHVEGMCITYFFYQQCPKSETQF